MLTQKTFDKIVFEYQHGGVEQHHPEINLTERIWLIKYLAKLPFHKDCDCEIK